MLSVTVHITAVFALERARTRNTRWRVVFISRLFAAGIKDYYAERLAVIEKDNFFFFFGDTGNVAYRTRRMRAIVWAGRAVIWNDAHNTLIFESGKTRVQTAKKPLKLVSKVVFDSEWTTFVNVLNEFSLPITCMPFGGNEMITVVWKKTHAGCLWVSWNATNWRWTENKQIENVFIITVTLLF